MLDKQKLVVGTPSQHSVTFRQILRASNLATIERRELGGQNLKSYEQFSISTEKLCCRK